MLTKLMKYEFKATARVMIPLCIIVLALASVTQITLWEFVIKVPGSDPNLVNIVLLAAAAAAMGAVLAASVVLIIQRFRSNLLGNEGHVMLTLPVSIHQHIWAKLIVAVFWMLITSFVLLESIMALLYNGTLWMAFPSFQEIFNSFISYITSFSTATPNLSLWAALAIVFEAILLTSVDLCLQIYVSLALGHSFHKHKALLSVVFFLVIQVLYQLAWNTLPYLTGVASYLFPTQSPTEVYLLDLGSSMVFSILWSAVLYGVTCYTLKHRLNLE